MILPVVAYGDPVLRKVAEEIDPDYPGLEELIANMFETMENAHGVGLAAPQIGKSIRLFVVDAAPFADLEGVTEEEQMEFRNFRRVFINPIILEETGDLWSFEEGCLSIPGINENVKRHENVLIEYYDENWDLIEEELSGIPARIVQHEYDHIEGILFTDHLSALRKKFVKKRLVNISKGVVDARYRMRFPARKVKL